MKAVKIKICGVTTTADAELAARAGADLIGVNLWPRSKRHVSVARAVQVAEAARAVNEAIEVVGVFVNQSDYEIRGAADAAELDYVQLHGDESAQRVGVFADYAIKAVALREAADVACLGDFPCDLVLVDAPTPGYGGSGTAADWSLAHQAVSISGKHILLAGGLRPDNVVAAIEQVQPWGVDVASGVEREPGVKDPELVREFIARARGEGY